nr:cobalt ABC transporter permease [uncultured Cohaesibacter sp.]
MTEPRKLVSGLFLLFLIAFASPAVAHKVVISAYAEGSIIEGEIGFSNGDVAADTLVEIFDDAGSKIGETTTDEDGIFQYNPTARMPLNFKANLGAGHIATYHMEVDELPGDIGGDAGAKAATAELDAVMAELRQETPSQAAAATSGIDPEALQKLIAAEVHAQLEAFKPEVASALRNEVKPLRKLLSDYMEKNDMQAILGGVGYICGLFGIGFYVAARKERAKLARSEKDSARSEKDIA